MVTAIIVAAGSSNRLGSDKIFTDIIGKPLIYHTLKAFETSNLVDEIIVITKKQSIPKIKSIASKNNFKKITKYLTGGILRQDTVWIGLENVSKKTNIVAIHDGARPLVTSELIDKCVKSITRKLNDQSKKIKAVSCASRISDTVKRSDENGFVCESISRDNLWSMQTPQVFDLELIKSAYKKIMAEGKVVTDEVSAVQEYGGDIILLDDHNINIKVTYQRDISLVSKFLEDY